MMETSRTGSSNQRGSDSDAGNVEGTVVHLEDLPEGHLVRLVNRSNVWPEAAEPVDWNAVMQRLESPAGALEARQWVQLPSGTRGKLFLHIMCSYDPTFAFPVAEEQRENAEHSFRAALKAIEVYPDAVGLPHAHKLRKRYPLHMLCGNPRFHRYYNGTAEKLFRKVLLGYPEAARVHSHGYTALREFALCCVYYGSVGYSTVHALEMLLELFPEAVRIGDTPYHCLPLHHALHGRRFDVIQTLLDAYPRAALLLEPSKPSCIQEHLCSCSYRLEASDYDITRLLLEACPWTLAHDDEKVLRRITMTDDLFRPRSGDTLDYLFVIYCDVSGVSWTANVDSSENPDDPEYHHYVHSNVAFLEGGYRKRAKSEQLIEATFDMLVTVLRTMYGRLDQCLPLHAAVAGSLCRPWHLVAMHAILSHFRQEANEVDSHGDLPLHLFLKSCMIEQDRAIERGYVNDAQEYELAIGKCFRMLLKANPEAAAKPNGDGRLPLHLALDHRSLAFNTLVSPLLDLSPEALLTLDTKTRLYPFANASIGADANLDDTFQLLRRDPTVLLRLDVSVGKDDSQGKRKRKRVDEQA